MRARRRGLEPETGGGGLGLDFDFKFKGIEATG